jgi:ADP-ribose pyrophosphatase YjhB (NUDIX family)
MRPNSLVLIIENEKLLAVKATDSVTGVSFCRPLGGGIEFGETSLVTAQREIKEEIGATLKNEKLLTVIENIFEFNAKKGHEITFLYSGEIAEKNLYAMEKMPILDKEATYAEWIPLTDIKSGTLKIFPEGCINFI